ncbi:glycosyltransferase 87 family protein [Mycolicibacterium gilvum]|uniref:Uncharacterized protein n=1 Tax=Mycolicibacterium gilvum (strain PYR-GCK) TaxID=350054 RepID=A4T4C3_MYCGI|nr:conserved hypothetical protein [Mycolicibacterium gilvum PYR-GCK]
MSRLALSRPALGVLAGWASLSVVLALTTVGPTANWGLLDGGGDLDVYRRGAWHVLSGLPLYDFPVDKKLFYTYTPFSALVFAPLELLPAEPDRHIWLALNLAVLIAVVVQSWRLLGYRVDRALVGVSVLMALGCVFVEPVRTTLFFGQINLILMLLILSDTVGATRSRLAGIGTGLAAGIKLTPLYFVLYFLTLRQRRVAVTAVAVFAATVVVGLILLPRDSLTYWAGTFLRSERIGDRLGHPSNQSLRGMLARLLDDEPPVWLWLALAVLIGVASLTLAVWLHRTGERLLSVTVVGLSSAVVSPFSWTHHWVWVVPLMVWFVHRALTCWRWWLAPAALFVALGAWPFWFRNLADPRIGFYLFPYTHVPEVLLRNAYLWLFAVLLIWLGVRAARSVAGAKAAGEEPVRAEE